MYIYLYREVFTCQGQVFSQTCTCIPTAYTVGPAHVNTSLYRSNFPIGPLYATPLPLTFDLCTQDQAAPADDYATEAAS